MPGGRAVALAALLVAVPYALMITPAARAAEQQAYAAGLSYVTPVVVAGRGDTLRDWREKGLSVRRA